ncbi:MAG: hypothetical protein JJU11_06560, partial [Candidatus Sumerlaeia bacterium]|nr:hypothetical protein [Candidatus Sumerlaeia bacterium]
MATRHVRLLLGIAWLLLILGDPSAVRAAVFPVYDRVVSHADSPTTDTWYLYPFFSDRQTTSTRTIAFHPLWDWHVDHETGSREFDFLFPLYTWRHHPVKGQMRDYRRSYLFPLYFHRSYERNGTPHFARILIPLWFAGNQGNTGTYRILF